MALAPCQRSQPNPRRGFGERNQAPTEAEPTRTENTELAGIAQQPWVLRVGAQPTIVRPTTPRDIAAVARMHRRCTARSLLDRYRAGGRPPAAAALDAELRNPFGFVVVRPGGEIIAAASVRRDPTHGYTCAEVSLLVEDKWQQQGIGAELMTHLAGVAQVTGFTELIAYPATAVLAAQRLMIDVGRTRMVPDGHAHLHTYLTEGAALGLGSVRQRLAG